MANPENLSNNSNQNNEPSPWDELSKLNQDSPAVGAGETPAPEKSPDPNSETGEDTHDTPEDLERIYNAIESERQKHTGVRLPDSVTPMANTELPERNIEFPTTETMIIPVNGKDYVILTEDFRTEEGRMKIAKEIEDGVATWQTTSTEGRDPNSQPDALSEVLPENH